MTGAGFGDGFLLPEWAQTLLSDGHADSLAEVVVEADLQAAFPHLRANDEFVAQLTASVRENLLALATVASGRMRLSDVELAQPRLLAALQARLGVPQALLQLSYRVGFLAIWRSWSSRLEEASVPADDRAAALQTLTELVFAYQNAALSQVAAEHVRTEAALQQSREHLRHRLIRDLLAGSEQPTAADLVTLGYDLELCHIAVCLEGGGSGLPPWITGIRARCQVWDAADFPAGEGLTVWWFGRQTWTQDRRRLLLDEVRKAGLPAEVSGQAPGLSGFRSGYQQLLKARAVRAGWARTQETERRFGTRPVPPAPVLSFDDVRVEAMVLDQPDTVAEFVRHELGHLAAPNRIAATLRQTLAHWLETRSHVATAEHLGLHEHTVRNRLRRIEELLGRPVASRPAELVLALRLRNLVGHAAAFDDLWPEGGRAPANLAGTSQPPREMTWPASSAVRAVGSPAISQ